MKSIEEIYQVFLQHPNITTDTRKINIGDLFFALKGPNFNGNLFAKQALEMGAAFVVIDEENFAENGQYILVPNVLEALQQLALHHRKQFNIPFIAITGSNGKTTTKELVSTVLSTTFKTYTTQGNLNNHIGVPLTILQIKKDAEMAVIEMGANHQKEIESYCAYTLPTHGLITNVGKAHLEGFGSEEGVKKGKGELFDFLRKNKGEVFVCSDFDYFKEMTNGLQKIHWYGTKNGEIIGQEIENDTFLKVKLGNGLAIQTQLVGSYNIYNVLAAVSVGKTFGVSDEKIKEGIENYMPSNSRSQMIEKKGNHIILDAYNANPSSMAAAIENFAKMPVQNKVLFLGAMAELGPESQAEHQKLVELIGKYSWKSVSLVGGDFNKIFHPYQNFNTAKEAADWWQSLNSTGNYLLVKGSRSMKMEQVVQ